MIHELFDQHVDVIWHDTPIEQAIAGGMIGDERCLHNLCSFRVFEEAGAVSGVLEAGDPTAEAFPTILRHIGVG